MKTVVKSLWSRVLGKKETVSGRAVKGYWLLDYMGCYSKGANA